jgi:DNA-binding NarL/FixJ family response regulator
MARVKKELTSGTPRFADRAASGANWSAALRAAAHGLFGKKANYHPTPQEIADYYLTPREREVAYLAALGFSITEIADALGLTFQTARAHLRNVLVKMQLDDPQKLCDYFLARESHDA